MRLRPDLYPKLPFIGYAGAIIWFCFSGFGLISHLRGEPWDVGVGLAITVAPVIGLFVILLSICYAQLIRRTKFQTGGFERILSWAQIICGGLIILGTLLPIVVIGIGLLDVS